MTKFLAATRFLVMPSRGFGGRLRDARERAGLSARGLSVLAGLAPGHVSTLEGDVSKECNLSTASALAKALGVRLEWLATGSLPERSRKAS